MSLSTLRENMSYESSQFLWDFEGVRLNLYTGDITSNFDQAAVEKLEVELRRLRFLLREKSGEFSYVLRQIHRFMTKVIFHTFYYTILGCILCISNFQRLPFLDWFHSCS